MSDVKRIEGELTAPNVKVALLVARFNSFIVDSLEAGAIDALVRHGMDTKNIEVIKVPGAFEMPLAAQKLAASGKYAGIVALGAVIRGGTPHFDYVAGECTKGLAMVSMQHNIPMGFGVLTVDSIEQAIERAGTKAGNKGAEAAMTVVEMINVLGKIG